MDISDERERDRCFRHLAGLVEGRKAVCGVAPLAALTDVVGLLTRAGARKPLVVYSRTGAGPLPAEEAAERFLLELPPAATMTEEIHAQERLLRNLPSDVVAAVDAYDPAREAVWCAGPFAASTEPLAGRTVVGGRRPEWGALEDKMVVDEIWDAVGHPRADRRLVDVGSTEELERASRELDAGHGVVWVADASNGFNGGGELTRWVATEDDRTAARAFLRTRCERVRVTPFLEGVPCSIHGLVMPDGTAALRPLELAILRGPGRRFVYGGQGTTWDPPAADREAMRQLVRRTGELLRERVGYAGGFGIDGVLTADGFRPTELNPRFSGGLTTLGQVLDIGFFHLLQWNLVAGRDPGVTVDDVERWALPELDRRRTVQPKSISSRPYAEQPFAVPVRWDGSRLHRDDTGPLAVLGGPTASGVFARVSGGDALCTGVRVGTLNAAMMRFLDEEMDAGFGPVHPAPDVRRRADVVPPSDGR